MMETGTRKPARNLPETIHSLLGLKSHLTSAWVKSVCNIVKTVSSDISSSPSPSKRSKNFQSVDEEDDAVSIEVQSIKDELSALNAYVNGLNIRRRQILNELLDLKGNIRVFCRVRPIKTERKVVASDTRNLIIKLTENKSKVYSFDRVFIPNSSQDEVFLEIEPVIKSVIDGYNACIFAYGQTGTGKTFTMEGIPENPGVVPRAMKALFEQAEESNHTFLINFSMLEIYMGNLKDLLIPQAIRLKDHIPPCLSIHTDAKGEIYIENLVAIKVNDFHHALKLYRLGCRNRATASTNSNSTSSRSHCMIRVSITCFGSRDRRRETNKIWLIDLGGSERVLKTRATGRRLDEGKAINLSLSALGDVINALQHKKSHIPYRNSKLTQVLKDSLGQDSKTLMLVHISPKEDDLCETLCSLNFATRAKNIHLGQNESMEKREKKESAMTNLHQTMVKIEQERQRVVKDIKHLNEKLEILIGKPIEQQQEEEQLIKEETPKKNISERYTNRLPSFMKPTVSSRKKSGKDKSVISNDSTARSRRPPRSTRAESVSFPVKKNDLHSICDSERSVSKSTCILRLANADNATVYSQDMSECEIKVVVSENKGKPLIDSGQIKSKFKIDNVEKNSNWRKGLNEFCRVDNWLLSQTENMSYVHSKKPVMAAMEDIEESNTEEITSKPMVMLKDLFELPFSCSSDSNDHDHDDYGHDYRYPSVAISQCTYKEEEEEEFSDRFIVENCSNQFCDYNADCEGYSSASISLSEVQLVRPKSQRSLILTNHVTTSDSDVVPPLLGSQESLALDDVPPLLGSQERLAFDDVPPLLGSQERLALDVVPPLLGSQERLALDVVPPLLGCQERLAQKGKAQMVMEKAEVIWFSALMALGFMDVGYGSNFFYGLTK